MSIKFKKRTREVLNDIKLGDTVNFDFNIVNTSGEKVVFTLSPCCGSCTTLVHNRHNNILLPEEELTITAKFTPQQSGKNVKCIRLYDGATVIDKFWFEAVVTE